MPTKPKTPTQSERTLKMKEAFMTLHNQGLSIKQIAHQFDLDSSTVYSYLQEIADQAGVSRESLLQTPRAKHLTHQRRFTPVKPVDLNEFHERFDATLKDFDRLLASSKQHLAEHADIAMKKEMEEVQW